MKCLKPSMYLMGALLVLGPVGLRMATRSDPPPQEVDREAAVGKSLPAYGGGRSGKDVPG